MDARLVFTRLKRAVCLCVVIFLVSTSAAVAFPGQQMWVRRYANPAGGDDWPTAITTDANGYIYVTGSVQNGPASGEDWYTIKYDPWGGRKWTVRSSSPGARNDWPYAIAADAAGNVYVTGMRSLATGEAYATIKYNKYGQPLWFAGYDGPGTGSNRPVAIAVDRHGSVYVTGSSWGGATAADLLTFKYSASGSRLWARRYDGAINSNDSASDLCLDGSGNAYITGSSYRTGTDLDYVTLRYSPSGVRQWVSFYNNSSANGYDGTSALTVSMGYVYVTGSSYWGGGGQTDDYDMLTVKYNAANGAELWNRRFEAQQNGYDVARDVAVRGGNVYTGGVSYNGGANEKDYVLLKYDAGGTQQWTATYNFWYQGNEELTHLVVDENENAYVTGRSYSAASSYNFCTVKYNTLGQQQWANHYDGGGLGFDGSNGIALGRNGALYVAGPSTGGGSSTRDYATVKYAR